MYAVARTCSPYACKQRQPAVALEYIKTLTSSDSSSESEDSTYEERKRSAEEDGLAQNNRGQHNFKFYNPDDHGGDSNICNGRSNVYSRDKAQHSVGVKCKDSSTKLRRKSLAMTTLKKITEKIGGKINNMRNGDQSTTEEDEEMPEATPLDYRRQSLQIDHVEFPVHAGRHQRLMRLVSAEGEVKPEDLREALQIRNEIFAATRPRSNSEVSRYKIVSKNGDDALFTVTPPSKLADVSALCQEYFSRVTCYDAVPIYNKVIAVDTTIPIFRVFNIFATNDANAVVLWNCLIGHTVAICHIDDAVCYLLRDRQHGDQSSIFGVEEDFLRPVVDSCQFGGQSVFSVPVETSLIDMARVFCPTPGASKCVKRIALTSDSTDDIVHLLSSWDILYFFSQQISKFRMALTAFDRTLGSILTAKDPMRHAATKVALTERSSLREAVNRLMENKGGAVPVILNLTHKKRQVTSIALLDIIIYVTGQYEMQNCSDDSVSNKTLLDVFVALRHLKPGTRLVYPSNTPLFAVLQNCQVGAMKDSVIIVVDQHDNYKVLGVLEPELLLATLLADGHSAAEKCQQRGTHM